MQTSQLIRSIHRLAVLRYHPKGDGLVEVVTAPESTGFSGPKEPFQEAADLHRWEAKLRLGGGQWGDLVGKGDSPEAALEQLHGGLVKAHVDMETRRAEAIATAREVQAPINKRWRAEAFAFWGNMALHEDLARDDPSLFAQKWWNFSEVVSSADGSISKKGKASEDVKTHEAEYAQKWRDFCLHLQAEIAYDHEDVPAETMSDDEVVTYITRNDPKLRKILAPTREEDHERLGGHAARLAMAAIKDMDEKSAKELDMMLRTLHAPLFVGE